MLNLIITFLINSTVFHRDEEDGYSKQTIHDSRCTTPRRVNNYISVYIHI